MTRPPMLNKKQSDARFRQLQRAGCRPRRVRLPNGDMAVIKSKDCPLQENQTPAPNALGWIVLGGFAVAAAYAIFSSKEAKAAPACALDGDKIDQWGKARDLYVLWLVDDPLPPTWAAAKSEWVDELWPEDSPTPDDLVVVTLKGDAGWRVISDDTFWRYVDGAAVRAPDLRADYCSFSGGA